MVPADACRFRRPFPREFYDCPSFEAVPFEATNMRDEPLASIWTCVHLGVAEFPGRRGHLYARCELGDLAARRRVFFDRLWPHRAA